MAKRSKSFRRYASGGNPRFSTLDAGLTAMRQQSDTQIRQLEKLSSQREKQDNIFIRALESKLSREADNRKEVYEIEEINPRKMRADALETNNQRRQDRFQQTIKEQEDLANTWGELSPTLAEASFKLASATQDYINIQNATDDYKELVQSGYLNDLSKFQDIQVKEGNKIVSAHVDLINKKAAEYLKTGDPTVKKEHDVLLYKYKTRNPKLQDLKAADIEADIDGFVRDFISMMEDPNSENPVKVDHTNVAALLQFRGAEVCRQIGVNPKSKAGLRIMKAFRKKGLEYQEQYTLGYEYNRDSAVVNDSVDFIKDSHKNNNYESANNNWKIMNSTYSTLPVESRTGEWSVPINVNPKESFKDLAIELMHNPRYANNWTLFSEEVLGKNAENKFGYEIVNPDKKAKNPNHNRILGRHPNLENELLIEWGRIHEGVKKTEKKAIEAKQTVDAVEFINRVNSDEYYRKPENQGKLWEDFKSYQNNPIAVAALGRSLAFSDETINKGLLKSQLFRDLRSGNTSSIIESWISAPEGDQDINWAHATLFDLADELEVEVNELDNRLVSIGKGTVDTIINDNVLTKNRHGSADEQLHKDMAAFMLNYYVNNRNKFDSTKAAWEASKAQLNFMLGIDANGIPIDPHPDTRIRGYGEFKHRVGSTGDSRVIFLSRTGTVYGNTSSGEIKEVLDGNKTKKQKTNFLMDAVAIQSQDHFSDALLLEAAATNGHTANHPILNQIYPHLKKLGIERKDFLQEVINKRFPNSKDQKDKFVQTIGSDWCDEHFKPAQNIKNPNDKLMAVCMDRVSKQTNIPISFLALYASVNPKVKEFLLEQRNTEETDGGE